eukprot:30139-Eustigmatos_ZCMA.PRE.1
MPMSIYRTWPAHPASDAGRSRVWSPACAHRSNTATRQTDHQLRMREGFRYAAIASGAADFK